MVTEVAHLVAIGIVIRVGSAGVWAIARRLLGVGVRIGTEEDLARRMAAKSACITCGGQPSHRRGERR